MDEECEYFLNSKSSASWCCLTFAVVFFSFSLVLLIKELLIKNPCNAKPSACCFCMLVTKHFVQFGCVYLKT